MPDNATATIDMRRDFTKKDRLDAGQFEQSMNKLEPSAKKNNYLFIATKICAALCLHAIPWLAEGYAWCGWVGMALAMSMALAPGIESRFLVMWLWCSGAIGLAFNWSPAAMAYTLSSGFALGFLVALPLILWDGLRLALTYWLAARLTREPRIVWLAAAVCAISLEYLMPGVFPWKLGCIQLSMPWSIQAVDVFGGSYSTFVAFAFAGAIHLYGREVWQFLKRKSRSSKIETGFLQSNSRAKAMPAMSYLLSPVIIALVLNAGYSAITWYVWDLRIAQSPKIQVGMIQVDPSYQESLSETQLLTASISDRVDLVCWPESSGGNYELDLEDLSDNDRIFQKSRDPVRGLRPWSQPHCELLFGGKNYVGDPYEPDELFVTAMLLDKQERVTGRYNKRFLMPFGEYVPAKDLIPGLSALFDMDEAIDAGNSACVLDSETGARIGTMLCYEDMVPQAARDATAGNANVLVSLINGSAFESPLTLYQHRLLSQMRSLECRRYFLRCAATGETCVINALGEVIARLPVQVKDALVCEVALLEGRTVYSRFPWLTPLLMVGLIATFLGRARRQRDRASVTTNVT